MHPFLAASLASNLTSDRIAAAHQAAGHPRRSRGAAAAAEADPMIRLVIRRATAADAGALERLGALDGNRRAGKLLGDLAREHDVLVAELDSAIVAARALDGAVAVADPFRPSALHADLLGLRARQLAGDRPTRSRLRRRLVLHPRTP
jgi:hypothetical protein